jgi:hypothetical protein
LKKRTKKLLIFDEITRSNLLTDDRRLRAVPPGGGLGLLLLFIMEPAFQLASCHIGLLKIAVEEGRVTLWVGSVVAALYILRDLF